MHLSKPIGISVLAALALSCGGSAPRTQIAGTPPLSYVRDGEYARINVSALRETPLPQDLLGLLPTAERRIAEAVLQETDIVVATDHVIFGHFAQPKANAFEQLTALGYQPRRVEGRVEADVELAGERARFIQVASQEAILCEPEFCAQALLVAADHNARRVGSSIDAIEPAVYDDVQPNELVHARGADTGTESGGATDMHALMARANNNNNRDTVSAGASREVPFVVDVLRNQSSVRGQVVFHESTAQAAQARHTSMSRDLEELRGNPMVAMAGFTGVLQSVRVSTSGNDVVGQGEASFSDLSRAIAIAGTFMRASGGGAFAN